MMQLSDAQIHSIRQQISRQVAFPEEFCSTFDETLAHEFLKDITACQTEEELQSFTLLLPRRRLNNLFGALLVVSAAEGEEPVLRLLSVLKQRMTPSLAEIGWAFFQNHFPNDRMNRVLSTIITELLDKNTELSFLRAVAQSADLPIIDDTLPARMALSFIQKPEINLSNFMVEMTILPDSSFASAFLANYFMGCKDQVFLENAELFIHALSVNEKEIQIRLVSNYLSAERLLPIWQPINQALLDKFGPPRSLQQQKMASLLGNSSDARFWDFLTVPVINNFRRWEMLYQLECHISGSPRKKAFYRQFNNNIREIFRWDDMTLVMIFDQFVIADNQGDDELVFYYELNTYQALQDGSRYNVFLNKPTMASQTARHVVLTQEKFNVVSLQLDMINLLYARDFINEKLGKPHIDPE